MRLRPIFVSGLLGLAITGCARPDTSSQAENAVVTKPTPPTFEAAAEDLLAMRLPGEETSHGWVRLFDGYTLFGWEIASAANWRVEDQSIVVDAGEQSLLCTSVAWADYELRLEFKADEKTNSGLFLRTPLEPVDPAIDCYEVNIAPTDNLFPSGSVVRRAKVKNGQPGSESAPLAADQWHLYEMTMLGNELTLRIDGQETCKYSDPKPLAPGRIGLQHNSGKVAFRNIKIRPLGLQPLLDKQLSQWTSYPDKPGEFVVTDEGDLHVTGGRGQLESKSSYADFVALIEAKTQSDNLNSGVFFRCLPGSDMDGYECQINHGIVTGNPLQPVDCGTGGIFRRQDARLVAATDQEWFSILLVADKLQVAAWVNGLQVTDWRDTRQTAENPRDGSRLGAGTMMLQAHDPTTDILFRKLDIADLAQP